MTGEVVPATASEYLRVTYKGFDRHLHRIVAEAFIPVPEGMVANELDVNHIDGVKYNNHVTNLEWATRSENCFHAYRTGLRDDNTPILVKDLRDNSITRYYSLQECARNFKVDGFTIHHHLKPQNRGKISWKYYVLIREGDEWPVVDVGSIGRHRNGTAKMLVAISEETGIAALFESVGAAAQHLKMRQGNIHMHIHRYGEKPYNGWVFKYLEGDVEVDKENIIRLKRKAKMRSVP